MTTTESLLIYVLLYILPVQNLPVQGERSFTYTEINNHSKVIDPLKGSTPLQINHTTKFQVIQNDSKLRLNRTLYYKIEPKEFSEHQKTEIKTALQELMTETCVKFVEHTMEPTYIHIYNSKSSSENVDYNGKNFNLYLPLFNSYTKDSIKRGFLQTLGLWDKHKRFHNTDYINEVQTQEGNFTGNKSKHNLLGLLHNYKGKKIFSTNQKTVNTDLKIVDDGQKKITSEIDIIKVNHLYNCSPIFDQKVNMKFRNTNYSELSNIGDLFEPEHYEKINFTIKSDLKNITYNYVTLSIPDIILKLLNAAVKNRITKGNFKKSGNTVSNQINIYKKMNDPALLFDENLWVKEHILANKAFIIENWNQLVESLGDSVIDIALDVLHIVYFVYKLVNTEMPENPTLAVKSTNEEDRISLYTTVDQIVKLLKNNI